MESRWRWDGYLHGMSYLDVYLSARLLADPTGRSWLAKRRGNHAIKWIAYSLGADGYGFQPVPVFILPNAHFPGGLRVAPDGP